MKMPVYSVRDLKGSFGSPFLSANDSVAVRSFAYQFSHDDSVMSFSIDDFDLYKIGEMDIDTGLILGVSPVEMICSGRSAMNSYGISRSEKS